MFDRKDIINLKNRMNSFLKELPKLYVAKNNDLKSLTAVTRYFENLFGIKIK